MLTTDLKGYFLPKSPTFTSAMSPKHGQHPL